MFLYTDTVVFVELLPPRGWVSWTFHDGSVGFAELSWLRVNLLSLCGTVFWTLRHCVWVCGQSISINMSRNVGSLVGNSVFRFSGVGTDQFFSFSRFFAVSRRFDNHLLRPFYVRFLRRSSLRPLYWVNALFIISAFAVSRQFVNHTPFPSFRPLRWADSSLITCLFHHFGLCGEPTVHQSLASLHHFGLCGEPIVR